MTADFRRRFWVSAVLSIPILALAPMIQSVLGVEKALAFPGDGCVQFVLSAAVFFYGGWPFLKGLFEEVGKKEPGMMTLIGTAIGAGTDVAMNRLPSGRRAAEDGRLQQPRS